jgi:hypothetical protein
MTEEEDEQPWAEPEPELVVEDEPVAEPEPAAEPKPDPQATPKPEPKPKAEPKPAPGKSHIDPFGEEAARLYVYLKDLTQSLPQDKREAMEKSGVSSKLDAIIDRVRKPLVPVPIPDEILGVPISPRLAKLIEYMRREKQHGRK